MYSSYFLIILKVELYLLSANLTDNLAKSNQMVLTTRHFNFSRLQQYRYKGGIIPVPENDKKEL
jgi:hypothetical protein